MGAQLYTRSWRVRTALFVVGSWVPACSGSILDASGLMLPVDAGSQHAPLGATETDGGSSPDAADAQVNEPPSTAKPLPTRGVWTPQGGGRVQDFAVFRYKGVHYVAALWKDNPGLGFRYAKSADLVQWTDLGFILGQRAAGAFDQDMVWAPHVIEEAGTYFMYFTGVRAYGTKWQQALMVASTQTPDDPASWQRRSIVQRRPNAQGQLHDDTVAAFVPTHEGHVWNEGEWSDCRDPMVFRSSDGQFHMYYSGRDRVSGTEKGVLGHAVAPTPLGPFVDLASTLVLPAGIPESPFVLRAPSGRFAVVFNHAAMTSRTEAEGPKVAVSSSLDGPFSVVGCVDPNAPVPGCAASAGTLGWAHEFLSGEPLLAAFLTGYFVTFRPASWNGDRPIVSQP